MKVIVPVAGVGTRLRPHTHSLPKPLFRVGGKAIIDHVLAPVLKLSPEEVIVVIGFLGELIREHVRANYRFNASFVDQDQLLGLGYALGTALRSIDGGDLLVLLGDTIVECDLEKFTRAGENVLGVRKVEDPLRFGIVTVENGRVIGVEEKPEHPKSNLALIGLYYFKDVRPLKKALERHLKSGKITHGEVQFTDALQLMIQDGIPFVPYEVTEWFDCGNKDTVLSTNRHLLTRLNQKPRLDHCAVVDPVFVDPAAQVTDSVIGPSVSIAEGCVIRNSIIRNSIIGPGTTIENMIIEDSLVGNETTLRGTGRVFNIGHSSQIDTA